MIKAATILFAAAIAMPGSSVLSDDEVHDEFRATITGYDPMPCCGSGIVMVLRGVEITAADGKAEKLYFIHADTEASGRGIAFAPGPVPYPAIGSNCNFDAVPHPVVAGGIQTNVPLRDESQPRAHIIHAIRC